VVAIEAAASDETSRDGEGQGEGCCHEQADQAFHAEADKGETDDHGGKGADAGGELAGLKRARVQEPGGDEAGDEGHAEEQSPGVLREKVCAQQYESKTERGGEAYA